LQAAAFAEARLRRGEDEFAAVLRDPPGVFGAEARLGHGLGALGVNRPAADRARPGLLRHATSFVAGAAGRAARPLVPFVRRAVAFLNSDARRGGVITMKRKSLRFGKGFRVAVGNRRSQAAEMVLAAGDAEGGPDNRHRGSDQWLYVLSGTGTAVVNG